MKTGSTAVLAPASILTAALAFPVLADRAWAVLDLASEHRVPGAAGMNGPQSVVIADMGSAGSPTPDGNPDVVVANFRSNDVAIFFGDGTGAAFSAISLGTLTGARRPRDVVAGDFDGSGATDLAVAACGRQARDRLVVVLDRDVANAVALPAGACPTAVAAGDLDQDLDTDLVVANLRSGDSSVFRGAGDGTFTGIGNVGLSNPDLRPSDVAFGDWGGSDNIPPDGIPDLVTPISTAQTTRFLAGSGDLSTTGAAAFPIPFGFLIPIVRAQAVAVADFDLDGNDDFAVGGQRGGFGIQRAQNLGIFLFGPQFAPSFAFEQGIFLDAGRKLVALAAANVSSDTAGRPDLIAVDAAAREVVVFEGRGGDTENAGQLFEEPVRVRVGRRPSAVAVASLEGGVADPDLDLAVTNYVTDDVSIVRNDSPVCGNGVTEGTEGCDPPGSPLADPPGHLCGPTCRVECASPRRPGPCPS
jgi:hypothetical protein